MTEAKKDQEKDESLKVLKDIRWWLKFILIMIVINVFFQVATCITIYHG